MTIIAFVFKIEQIIQYMSVVNIYLIVKILQQYIVSTSLSSI